MGVGNSLRRNLEDRLKTGKLIDKNETRRRSAERDDSAPLTEPVRTPPQPVKKARSFAAGAGIVCKATPGPDTGMNLTETAYSELLEVRRLAGIILDYEFGVVKLKVGLNSWYVPDFRVILPDHRLFLVDVKPFRIDKETQEIITLANEDSMAKIKTVPLLHPHPVLLAYGRSLGKGKGYEFRHEWAGGHSGGIEWDM